MEIIEKTLTNRNEGCSIAEIMSHRLLFIYVAAAVVKGKHPSTMSHHKIGKEVLGEAAHPSTISALRYCQVITSVVMSLKMLFSSSNYGVLFSSINGQNASALILPSVVRTSGED